MTHAQKKASLGQYRGERRDHVGGWSYGETVGGAWPVRSLREVNAKKDMMSREKKDTCGQYKDRSQCAMKTIKIQKNVPNRSKCKTRRKQRTERKFYSLRGRSGSENEALSCHVLLTRLDGCEVDTNTDSEYKTILKSNKKTVENRETLKTKTDKPLAQEPRKRRLASLNAEAVNSLLLEKPEGPSAAKLAKKQVNGASAPEQTKTRSSAACRKAETQEKSLGESSLFAPTPRRLAGLNAAALLKLTSSTAAHKQRLQTDGKSVCASGKNGVHNKPKAQKSKKHSWKRAAVKGGCEVCKNRCFESKLKIEESPEHQHLTKPVYQSQSMLGYPLKVIKEEQLETELSPCYCCPSEGSVEYCHRLALFLGQKSYGETEDHAVTSVKRERLIPPALTVSAHPFLCTDPCYSGFYVRISHPAAAGLSALPWSHSPFCPRQVSGASGIPHSAFCNSSCFHEACTVNRCTFRSIRPISSRMCSYSTSCSQCTHAIETGYSSCEEDQKSEALLVSRVNSSSADVSRLISTHTDIRAKKCPQNSKASHGSLVVSHTPLSQKRPTASTASVKQKKVNRRPVTNGWRPVGVPTEREVFIAGDHETVFRQCYEGVERDGEVIRVRDTVLLRSGPRKKSLPYVAKISSLWEDPRTGELMMSLFWYYRPEHTQGGRDPSMHCENEIFASRHQDENSVACIEDRCYVLPLAQYCRFCALVKRRSEGVSGRVPVVPCPSDSFTPPHRLVHDDVDPDLVYLCRHVYDFRYGRILKNLQ